MQSTARADDVRPQLALIGVLVVAALVLLYLANVFYIQSLLVVWGAAIISGSYVYDRRKSKRPSARKGGESQSRIATIEERLASVEERLANGGEDEDRADLRSQSSSMQRELRRLRWEARESDMEAMTVSLERKGLAPLPPAAGFWEKRRQRKEEQAHLVGALDQALGVLVSDPPDAARASMAMIAADLRANYGMMKGSGRAGSLGDFGAAWGVLHSVSRGEAVDHATFFRASRLTKSRLTSICDLAAARGVLPK